MRFCKVRLMFVMFFRSGIGLVINLGFFRIGESKGMLVLILVMEKSDIWWFEEKVNILFFLFNKRYS